MKNQDSTTSLRDCNSVIKSKDTEIVAKNSKLSTSKINFKE